MNTQNQFPVAPEPGSIHNHISSLVNKGFKLTRLQGSNPVYKIDAKQKKPLVFKLYKHQVYKREKLALEMLSAESIKCPKLLDSGVLDEKYYWILYKYIEGKRMCDVDVYSFTNSIDFFYELGSQLAKIHTTSSLEIFSEDERMKYIDARFTRFISKSKAYLQRLCSAKSHHSLLFKEAFGFINKHAEQAFSTANFSLVLHDFSPSNIIVSEIENELCLAGIIDYEFFMYENRTRISFFYCLILWKRAFSEVIIVVAIFISLRR